jgi:predicted metal-dependent hydrolase
MPLDEMLADLNELLFERYRNQFSREYTLAITGALEHFTALGAHALFDKRDVLKDAHPNVRALYAWHAIEEVEHKGVAYDVMIDYAKVGYFKRIGALLHATVKFPMMIFKYMNIMLKKDGFSWWQRAKLNVGGLWWLLKPGGFVGPLYSHYFAYYKPGYHPWDETEQPGYAEWLTAFDLHRDPVEASELMRATLARA